MMRSDALRAAVFLGATLAPSAATAAAVVGQPAPSFSLADSNGKTHALGDYKGKVVVVEWVNPSCPFVKKHYDSGNMPSLQKTATGRGVVWLAVNTSGGRLTADQANAFVKEKGAAPTALLLDGDATVARAYGAKTTPHMFVIDPRGVLVYAGAIDDTASTDPADIATSKNYVRAALDATLAGRKVEVASTPPYGCAVKYEPR
jgi:peroxiredoxin